MLASAATRAWSQNLRGWWNLLVEVKFSVNLWWFARCFDDVCRWNNHLKHYDHLAFFGQLWHVFFLKFETSFFQVFSLEASSGCVEATFHEDLYVWRYVASCPSFFSCFAKWIVIGRLQPGHLRLFSSPFAALGTEPKGGRTKMSSNLETILNLLSCLGL